MTTDNALTERIQHLEARVCRMERALQVAALAFAVATDPKQAKQFAVADTAGTVEQSITMDDATVSPGGSFPAHNISH